MRAMTALKILFLSLAWSTVAVGEDCPGAIRDYFAPSGKMPSGKFIGKCLETHKRSFRLVEPEAAAHVVPEAVVRSRSATSQFVANVSHDGDFWTAVLPKKDGIESLTFLVERFVPRWLAAHTMLRAEFTEPVLLFCQTHPERAPVQLKNLILTVEALAYQGGPQFNPISTLGQGFALATRFQSLEDRVAQAIDIEKNTVRQYRLNLTNDEKDLFWWAVVNEVHDPDMKGMYNLINRNCMNVLFRAIDIVVGRARSFISRIATFYPLKTKSALAARGLLENREIHTLNQELIAEEKSIRAKVCPMNLLPEAETIVAADQLGP
jgi:hypothetical protein